VKICLKLWMKRPWLFEVGCNQCWCCLKDSTLCDYDSRCRCWAIAGRVLWIWLECQFWFNAVVLPVSVEIVVGQNDLAASCDELPSWSWHYSLLFGSSCLGCCSQEPNDKQKNEDGLWCFHDYKLFKIMNDQSSQIQDLFIVASWAFVHHQSCCHHH